MSLLHLLGRFVCAFFCNAWWTIGGWLLWLNGNATILIFMCCRIVVIVLYMAICMSDCGMPGCSLSSDMLMQRWNMLCHTTSLSTSIVYAVRKPIVDTLRCTIEVYQRLLWWVFYSKTSVYMAALWAGHITAVVTSKLLLQITCERAVPPSCQVT